MKKPKPKIIDMQKAQREITERYAIEFERQRQEAKKDWQNRLWIGRIS